MPLHMAAERGDWEMVRVLVDAGANIDKPRPEDGRTPLFQAAWRDNLCWENLERNILRPDHLRIVRLLVENRADANQATHTGETAQER